MTTTASTVVPGIDRISTDVEIGGFGCLTVNAYVLHGAEPILVEAGTVAGRDEFMAALRTVIDPADLRWLWLSHTDPDHIGSIPSLLEQAPRMRVITTFFGMGILNLCAPLPPDRVNFVNPGEHLVLSDRTLTGVKPPAYDNPVSTGFRDDRTGIFFSSDSFGALLPEVPERADEIDRAVLRQGQVRWATVDSPWLHDIDTASYARTLDSIRRLEPTMVLSGHLPPASGAMLDFLLGSLAEVPGADPFEAPTQAALEAMLAQAMAGAPN
jgi:glyoxylase-like metal-dependent hydrolase (beta-lactamase superfamily II)